ncbi:LysR family transcriptional regulator [Bordetella petrii]|uniref:LysR family transcriptional regulator n=1 Tax=Bordetella petrii TaxID=94624 RepID=UPI003733BD42
MAASAPDAGEAHRLDLNLVRLMVAVFETGSVSLAAERLALTQPTVSYGLAKLRQSYGDALFVRDGRGMAPTPRAEQIYAAFQEALACIDSTQELAGPFVPASTTRRFRVAMSDIGGLCFLPPLMARLRRVAPQASLEVLQVPVDTLIEQLASGKADAAVGNLPMLHDKLRNQPLFREHYVCLMARGHPAAASGKLSLAAFLATPHVLVSSPFFAHQRMEETLRAQGVHRKIALRIPHFTILPGLIAQSDLMAILPSRVARVFESYGNLQSLPLPVAIPEFEVCVHTHAYHAAQPAVQWFAGQVVLALQDL